MKTTVIEAPDSAEAEKEQTSLVHHANQLLVKTQSEHGVGLAMLKAIAIQQKKVAELFKEPTAAAHAAHKAITAAEKKLLDPLEQASKIVWNKCSAFEQEQIRIAQEQERKLQEAARMAEEERQLLEAIEAEKEGQKEEAEEILAAPVEVPKVHVAVAVAKVEGISSRWNYGCRVVNKDELIRYVAANLAQWSSLLEPAESELNKLAKAMREGFKIPGCELTKESVLSRRV